MASTVSQPEPAGLDNILALLENITTCINTAGSSLPCTKRESATDVSIEPPHDGISLLDTKCDLLLSYIQNLVFLMIFQLRRVAPSEDDSTGQDEETTNQSLREEVTKKLVELRTYLDRGVRPLEGRLKYQVDKVIKAAEDADRAEQGAPSAKGRKKISEKDQSDNEDASGSDDASSESELDSEEEEEDINEMAYRPNVSAFSKKVEPASREDKSSRNATSDGVYRPPRIMPTAMPTTERKERKERGPSRRSNVIDEFVSAEMSSAPMAEPSIGSTIVNGGRNIKSKKEREYEAERTAYEETNFIRLAKESKKERAKRTRGQRAGGTFGGEEWRGLTEGADRITKLTKRAKGTGHALDRSRKRKLTEDGQRGDGAAVGQIFEKRRKKVEGWKR